MRKFVWVPVINLGRKNQGQFLEIMSEPARLGGVNMDTLKNSGLNKNITATEAILKRLAQQPENTNLYLTSFLINLSNTQGINLGLVLASFIQTPSCPYQKIIVAGQVDVAQPSLPITASNHFDEKVEIIIKSGKQPKPIPFFFSRTLFNEKHAPLLSKLLALNIVLKPIDNLMEALSDFGLPPGN
ncbi:MAG: hypothetical protein ABL903_13875 [Methylococcales bacterium]